MRAGIHHAYGAPEAVLSVQTVNKPMPKDDEVLVRVRAASMHPDVWHVIVGYPLILRLMGNGVSKPARRIPGTDLSGVVESVGRNVTRFKAGDEVFGESAKFGWLNGGAMLKKPEAMAIFRELLESGKLTPIVARTFSLGEVPAAMRWMQESNSPGRALITP